MKNLSSKFTISLFTVILACIVLAYTACTKTEVKTSTTTSTSTSDEDAVAAQIAQNFYKAITGGYSGMNINNGINASLSTAPNRPAHSLNSVSTLCGYTIDTTYNSTTKRGDTTNISSGSFKFTYTCTTNAVNGYTLGDTISSNVSDSTFRSVNSVSQNYAVKAIDNTYKRLLTNGIIFTVSNYNSLHKGVLTGYNDVVATYLMSDVKVDNTSGIADMVSGKATFHMSIENLVPSNNPANDGTFMTYDGTITYLGHYLANLSVTYNGKTKNYRVNMLTGATTQI